MGLLVAVFVVAAGGFEKAFIAARGARHISAEAVKKIHEHRFEVLPGRWVVDRTWS